MNKTKLKTYASQARRDFIQAVTDRAAFYGLTAKNSELITEQGDVAIIAGKAFPRAVARKRRGLEERIARQGFEQTMEALAYTWFNRFVAIRFMELHGYLDHGYRVLSHPEGKGIPEILEHAEHVELPRLDKNTVIDLKLDGSKEAELYRLLLIAQCNALHEAMPFLFEQIDDETELLLPDNLLHSDSLIRKLVNEIDEEDWQEVEIIGWLYQFYISEKKDQVIGKVVKSEDIPAATQLFTPNWIVKYLVQNSLGRQWLATYPQSSLRQQMEYYIEPAEQTPEVQAQLKAITPESLNPEELTLLDPACGSGHILVEAYDLFKAIYQERGYRARDIPTLILRKNLFGLEIDDRAAQLAAFALMMKARADDRRIFANGVQPNVVAIQESKGLNAKALWDALNVPLAQGEKQGEKGNISPTDISDLITLFEHGKTFGSLIQVPPTLAEKLPALGQRVREVSAHGDLMTQPAAKVLLPLIEQAWMLSRQYDAVVANPPYMGSNSMNSALKQFAKNTYPDSGSDSFAMFIEHGIDLARVNGRVAMLTMQSWMFLASFQLMREWMLSEKTIETMAHLGPRAFSSISGEVVTVTAFNILNVKTTCFRPVFLRLLEGDEKEKSEKLKKNLYSFSTFQQSDFRHIPGSPIAYWISKRLRDLFVSNKLLKYTAQPLRGVETGDNSRFLKIWFEVDFSQVGIGCKRAEIPRTKKWFPYNKGGEFCKWFGNRWLVIDWENDGYNIKHQFYQKGSRLPWRAANADKYFETGITWGGLTSSTVSFRFSDYGAIFDSNKGAMLFPLDQDVPIILGFLNSKIASLLLNVLNPTLSTQNDDVGNLPFDPTALSTVRCKITDTVEKCVGMARQSQNQYETSWDFRICPLLERNNTKTVQAAFDEWSTSCLSRFYLMKSLEEQNNCLFIEAYGLQDELSPEVPEEQITLARPDREEDIKRLISYAIGCMMGRYSLNHEIHESHERLPSSPFRVFGVFRGARFEVDPDAIVPIMDTDWFPDDAANRFVEFIGVAWPKEHLEENLTFIADSLGPNRNEQARDTIRRYLAQSFFKDHLKTYKRRPIYWLFSSGKQRAFQCLVYLHRYNESTLSRMRTEYVIPLQGKINARIEHLTNDAQQATSTSHRKKLEKEQDTLRKQQAELLAFDEKLRHYADMRISLDLDDGVKVNYGKFGDLLAEVKAVCGEE